METDSALNKDNPFRFEDFCGSCDNFPGDNTHSPSDIAFTECPFKGKVCTDTEWKKLGCNKYWN